MLRYNAGQLILGNVGLYRGHLWGCHWRVYFILNFLWKVFAEHAMLQLVNINDDLKSLYILLNLHISHLLCLSIRQHSLNPVFEHRLDL